MNIFLVAMSDFLVGVTFDWTISLGQIVSASMVIFGVYGGVMKLYHALDKRIYTFEQKIEVHAATLKDHASRMERWEVTLFKVTSDLSHVLGRLEVRQEWDGRNRRDDSRN